MKVETIFDGFWLWFRGRERPPYKITGKYLFFSEDFDLLKNIAIEEIRANGFHVAKINTRLLGKNTEHVLCLYYEDDSRRHELAEKYQGMVKYRYWKSDKDTLEGKYSEEFLSELTGGF